MLRVPHKSEAPTLEAWAWAPAGAQSRGLAVTFDSTLPQAPPDGQNVVPLNRRAAKAPTATRRNADAALAESASRIAPLAAYPPCACGNSGHAHGTGTTLDHLTWTLQDVALDIAEDRTRGAAIGKAQAAAFLAQTQPAAAREKGESIAKYAERWLASREGRISSIRDDRSRLRDHVLPLIANLDVATFTRDDVERVRDDLDRRIALPKGRAGALYWKTAREAWFVFTRMCRDMAGAKRRDLRVRKEDAAAGVAAPERGPRKAKQFLYPSELLAFVGCPRVPLLWRRAVVIAIYTYARDGELRALEWSDADLEHRTIHITRAWDRRLGKVGTTKTEETRRIPIHANVVPLLQAMREESGGTGPLVELPSERDMARGLRRWLRNAGVAREELHETTPTSKAITFHDLRATGITWAAIEGLDLLKIMQRAGHTETETTMVYVREAENLREGFGTPFPALLLEDLGVAPASVPLAPTADGNAESADGTGLRGGRDSNPRPPA